MVWLRNNRGAGLLITDPVSCLALVIRDTLLLRRFSPSRNVNVHWKIVLATCDECIMYNLINAIEDVCM